MLSTQLLNKEPPFHLLGVLVDYYTDHNIDG